MVSPLVHTKEKLSEIKNVILEWKTTSLKRINKNCIKQINNWSHKIN